MLNLITKHGRPYPKFFWNCPKCHLRLSEYVQTDSDLWTHDNIWHNIGNIQYFEKVERVVTDYGGVIYVKSLTREPMVVRY